MKKMLAVVAVLGMCLTANAVSAKEIIHRWVRADGFKDYSIEYVPDPPSKYTYIDAGKVDDVKAELAAKKAKDEQDRRASENYFHDNGWQGRYKEYVNPVTKQRILVDPETRNIKLPE